jgi:hypothetical protein
MRGALLQTTRVLRSAPQKIVGFACRTRIEGCLVSQGAQFSTTMATPPASVKVALLQILAGNEKNENLQTAVDAIDAAAKEGAQIISLPECFNRSVDTYAISMAYLN